MLALNIRVRTNIKGTNCLIRLNTATINIFNGKTENGIDIAVVYKITHLKLGWCSASGGKLVYVKMKWVFEKGFECSTKISENETGKETTVSLEMWVKRIGRKIFLDMKWWIFEKVVVSTKKESKGKVYCSTLWIVLSSSSSLFLKPPFQNNEPLSHFRQCLNQIEMIKRIMCCCLRVTNRK